MFDDDSIKNTFKRKPKIKSNNYTSEYYGVLPMIIKLTIAIILLTVLIVVAVFNHTNNYETDVRNSAIMYDPDDITYYDKSTQQSVNSIKNTSNCDELKTMFVENFGWNARPMLADKILKTCFK